MTTHKPKKFTTPQNKPVCSSFWGFMLVGTVRPSFPYPSCLPTLSSCYQCHLCCCHHHPERQQDPCMKARLTAYVHVPACQLSDSTCIQTADPAPCMYAVPGLCARNWACCLLGWWWRRRCWQLEDKAGR